MSDIPSPATAELVDDGVHDDNAPARSGNDNSEAAQASPSQGTLRTEQAADDIYPSPPPAHQRIDDDKPDELASASAATPNDAKSAAAPVYSPTPPLPPEEGTTGMQAGTRPGMGAMSGQASMTPTMD